MAREVGLRGRIVERPGATQRVVKRAKNGTFVEEIEDVPREDYIAPPRVGRVGISSTSISMDSTTDDED